MATLSDLQAQLAKLDAALKSGMLSVEIGDRKIVYRSMDELERAKNHLTTEIDRLSAAPRYGAAKRFTFATHRGD